jgi:poly-gamma-glutamate synthase PgsB/CapB
MNLDWITKVYGYFHSVYGNTIFELGIFILAASAYFLGRHFKSTRDIVRARAKIPVMIGGWGTRGKSGTERIKAALFNALGYSVFSKTTGTEAMFVAGPRYGKLTEMFLFRPYDKATIWEQGDVIKIAAGLNADIFLWECMALTPDYVQVLQRDWMKDDLATITNTYPDHEDLQGPAGIDIPEVMTRFIPEASELVTTEESMMPILREAARTRGTQFTEVGWLEAGLPTEDVLARFPYEEHPSNIALVIEIARRYGIRGDFALKEMADRVVPDLGVLKVYDPAPILNRTLQFVSGQAANERFGFLASWRRTDFDTHDPEEEPGTWLATVVNNREDRVPRSRVFADILVRDAMADRHFLIGTNLNGFLAYLEESWDVYAQEVTLCSEDSSDPSARLDELVRRFRAPLDRSGLVDRLGAMLNGIGVDSDRDKLEAAIDDEHQLSSLLGMVEVGTAEDLIDHVDRLRQQLSDLDAFRDRLRTAGESPDSGLDDELRNMLHDWFMAKIVVIWDSHSTGDETIGRIARELPPGINTRIMGCQNIKGTGLDFAYRWVAWDSCVTACRDLVSGDANRLETGLRSLAQLPQFGVICHERLRAALAELESNDSLHNAPLQSRIREIEDRLNAESPCEIESAESVKSERRSDKKQSRWVPALLGHLESFLDAGDAIKRRREANRIYRDLMAERVSSRAAVAMLQALTKRQKGGWLEKSFARKGFNRDA